MSHSGQSHLETITRARLASLKPPIQHLRRVAFAEEQIKYSISQCSNWLDLQFCVRWPIYSNLISEFLLGFGKPSHTWRLHLLALLSWIHFAIMIIIKKITLWKIDLISAKVATKCPFAWGRSWNAIWRNSALNICRGFPYLGWSMHIQKSGSSDSTQLRACKMLKGWFGCLSNVQKI